MIGRTTRASRKVNPQLCAGLPICPQIAAIVVASSLSFYLCMYICMLSEPHVSEVPQVAQFTLVYIVSQVNIKKQETNFIGKLYSIRLTSCKAWRSILNLCSLVEPWSISPSQYPCQYNQHREPKENAYLHSGCQKHDLIVFAFLLYEQLIFMCTNYLEYKN